MVNRVLQRIPKSVDALLPGMIVWPDNMDQSEWYYLIVQEATNSHEHTRNAENEEIWVRLVEAPDWAAYEK